MAFDSIKALPIDQTALGLIALEVSASTDQDGQQKTDREGTPFWLVACYGKNPSNGGLQTVEVRIAADKAPNVTGPVVFTNLIGRPWAMAERSGITVSADSVALRNQQSAPAAR